MNTVNNKRFGLAMASILLLILGAIFIGVGNARADQSAEDHAAHHPKQDAKAISAPASPTTKPSETVDELRAKIAKLEAQLKEKSGGMGMGMMMGGGKEAGGMGMKGMGMMGGKDSPQGAGMSCCMCDGGMMNNGQRQGPTTQPHSHDHK
jgi:hypothetical protein